MHMNDENNNRRPPVTHLWQRENGTRVRNSELCGATCVGIGKFTLMSSLPVLVGSIPIACTTLPILPTSVFLQMLQGSFIGGAFTSSMIASFYFSQMNLDSEQEVNRYLRDSFHELTRFSFENDSDSQTSVAPSYEWMPVCGMQAVAGTSLVGAISGATNFTPALCAGLTSVAAVCCTIIVFKGRAYCSRLRNNEHNADMIVTELPREIQIMRSQNPVGQIPYIPMEFFIREVAVQDPQAARQLEQLTKNATQSASRSRGVMF